MWPAPMGNPCSIFLGADLVFLGAFLRGGGGTHSCLCPIFQRPGLLWAGVNRSGQRLRGTPAQFFVLVRTSFCFIFSGIFEKVGWYRLLSAQSFKGLVLLLVSDKFHGNRGISA